MILNKFSGAGPAYVFMEIIYLGPHRIDIIRSFSHPSRLYAAEPIISTGDIYEFHENGLLYAVEEYHQVLFALYLTKPFIINHQWNIW